MGLRMNVSIPLPLQWKIISIAVLLGAILVLWFVKRRGWITWTRNELAVSLFSEFLGALLITLMFSFIIDYVENEELKATLQDETAKALLIYDMGSQDNNTVHFAVERLRGRGWLSDKTLKDKYFGGANLRCTDLQDAILRGSSFEGANLEGSDLSNTDLRGSIFTNANLANVQLDGALFDDKTILPSGAYYDPGQGSGQFDSFIDPTHLAIFPVLRSW